tara:strand:+ start:1490 stop:2146 length:657 start_codon:yes stop_codon:yes gene_type:complete
MSHNTNKINTVEPNRAGSITQSFSDLNDVSINSVSDGQFVQYDNAASAWKNVAQPTSTTFNYMQIGAGSSDNYSNAGAGTNISAGDKLRFYAPSSVLINNIVGASVNSNSDWIDYVTIPSGNYVFLVSYGVEFSGSGFLVYEIAAKSGLSGYVGVAQNAVIGPDTTSYDSSASQIVTYLTFGSQVEIAVKVQNLSLVSAVSAQGNTPSERGSLMIIKV